MNPRSRSSTGLRLGPQIESRLRSGEWNSWGPACGGGGCVALGGLWEGSIISRVWRGEHWEWGRLVVSVNRGRRDRGRRICGRRGAGGSSFFSWVSFSARGWGVGEHDQVFLGRGGKGREFLCSMHWLPSQIHLTAYSQQPSWPGFARTDPNWVLGSDKSHRHMASSHSILCHGTHNRQ